jgi:hypothetical protein
MVADARQYLLDLGRQTPFGAEDLKPEEVERILLREKRKVKKARRKARDFSAVGGVLEMVDGKEVLRIGGQLFYPEAEDGIDAEDARFEAEVEEEPEVPTPERVLSDRFIGSHVVAPVSMHSTLRHVVKRNCSDLRFIPLLVPARWCLSFVVDERFLLLFSTRADSSFRSKDET